MNIVLTTVSIITPLFTAIGIMANKNYVYFMRKSLKIIYVFGSLIYIPLCWDLILLLFKSNSEKTLKGECLKNVKNIFDGYSIPSDVFITLSIIAILGSIYTVVLMRVFQPNNKE
jgi:hypothetical protein